MDESLGTKYLTITDELLCHLLMPVSFPVELLDCILWQSCILETQCICRITMGVPPGWGKVGIGPMTRVTGTSGKNKLGLFQEG